MKNIISYFVQTFKINNINWSAQMAILKRLLKTHTQDEIIFAIGYYKRKGVNMYSLGYLFKTMGEPMRELKALKTIATQTGDSYERNQQKFRINNQAFSREKYNLDLFE